MTKFFPKLLCRMVHPSYLQGSKHHHLLLSALDVFQKNGPLGLLIQLVYPDGIILYNQNHEKYNFHIQTVCLLKYYHTQILRKLAKYKKGMIMTYMTNHTDNTLVYVQQK